jgi:sugar/nucleoside kinase (ribokinase family)
MTITVAGAAAVKDYIFQVERLPARGEIIAIAESSGSDAPYWGGSAPNIACSLARLGEQAELVYPVGEDFAGSGAERAWLDTGVNLDGVVTVPGTRSGFAYLFFEANGDSMCFAFPGAAASAPPPQADPRDFVVIAPVFGAFTQPVLETALRRKLRVVVSGIGAAGLLPYLPDLYGLLINAGEADALCQRLGFVNHGALAVHMRHPLLYITSGSAGSCVYVDGQPQAIAPVPAARFVDPTGAGDSYTAGVVAALLRGFDPVTAAVVGATNASFVVEAFGAQTNLPSWAQIAARLAALGMDIHTSSRASQAHD